MILQLELGKKNPILRSTAEFVHMAEPGFDVKSFCEDLVETMVAEKGVGLAAPQVGQSVRIIAVGSENEPLVLINPEVTFFSKDKSIEKEGCLSLPGEEYFVERPKKIRYKYVDISGKLIKSKAKGLLARVIQHEIDHLDGVLISDIKYE